MLFLPLILLKQNRKHTDTVAEGRLFPNFKELFEIAVTFLLVVIGWVFFRADTISIAIDYINR
ncbi:MAG TPA: MBOAT family protein, partial [Bacteroidia bacterium]|nr:MBOAT family protein [Bacteroidia bacterium]